MDEQSTYGKAPFNFVLPQELNAGEPPEKRGITRDKVKLMVIQREDRRVMHSRFDHLREFLKPGDLLVFNSSRTLPASLQGCGAPIGPCIEVRLAQHLPDDSWLALLICRRGDPFTCGLRPGMNIDFGQGLNAEVEKTDDRIPRLWKLSFNKSGSSLIDMIYRLGQPIRYEYISSPWGLDYYQTVYAREPGSAEMPSAGRAFTWKMLFDLERQGINSAYLTLHTGLSSYLDDQLDRQHPASEEEYFIGETAAAKINKARETGGRIIAIGTTVVRALESAANDLNRITAGHDYTRLHIDYGHSLRIADGLITGLHEPEASHLDLLSAFIPPDLIREAYDEAIRLGYLWHEFGDLNLII
jgi:S-adenosylmethionine:tRNA ribosyltransferase-isomerase